MMKRTLIALSLVAAGFGAVPAKAQSLNAMRFVASCGTPPPSSPLLPNLPMFSIDAAGNLCVSGGGGGGGGGGAVTIAGPLGPSITANNSVATTFGSGTLLPAFAAPPLVYLNGSAPNSVSNPAYASITNFPATQSVSGSVGISGTLPGFTAPPNVLVGLYSSTLPTLSSGQSAAVAIDVNGKQLIQGGNSVAVKTDGSATTQPVSGTVSVSNFPGTQTVSGTVTANLGTLNGAATDNSVAALGPKLDTLHSDAYPAGTAGSPSSQVITVQPPSSGGTTFPTAPQSAAPNIRAASQTLGSGTATAVFATGPLGSTTLNLSGTASETVTVYGSSDDTNYTDQLFLRPMGLNGSLTAPLQSVVTSGAAINNNYLIETAAYSSIKVVASNYTSGSLSAYTLQTGGQRLVRAYNSPFDPLSIVGQYVPPQRSSAAETCHAFTKSVTTSSLRSLAVSAQSTSPLWLFVLDLAAVPASATNQAAALLMAPQKMGSDGSSIQGAADFSGAPLPTTNAPVACLSTTPAPTYTAAGAIGWFTGQVQ